MAKSVFRVHGIDAPGNVIVRRRLKRRYILLPPEAAAVSGRYRSLRLGALLVARTQALGHTIQLMPPAYVKPHVKRHKNDAIDARSLENSAANADVPN
jgi:transposase